jgi:hypothetical protein
VRNSYAWPFKWNEWWCIAVIKGRKWERGEGPHWYVHTSLPQNIRGVQYVIFHMVNGLFRNNYSIQIDFCLINSTVVGRQLLKLFRKDISKFPRWRMSETGGKFIRQRSGCQKGIWRCVFGDLVYNITHSIMSIINMYKTMLKHISKISIKFH